MMILIAGTGSGSGKTTVTAGILQCLKDRGLRTAAFKCGPDYIDPMFYSRITGTPAGNLDPFFLNEDMLKSLAAEESRGADISVIEGVMGYYDGIGFSSEASTFSVARALQAPVILVVNCRGAGASAGAVLKGFLDWPEITGSGIKGVIFNCLPQHLYGDAAEMASSMGVKPLGCLPHDSSIVLESRHLGLVTPEDAAGLNEKMKATAAAVKKYIDIEGILDLAATAPAPGPARLRPARAARLRVALASDEAFCFTYRENLTLLQELGCRIIPFSPLHDSALPEGTDGLILSGGYPELHAAQLAANTSMLDSVRNACMSGVPTIAECGGFMYLHETLEGDDGAVYRMAGVVPGHCRKTDRLGRFGYINMKARSGGLLCPEGTALKAHEFHYWDSDFCGKSFIAEKPGGSRSWECGVMNDTMYAGFPHLYLAASPAAAERFVKACGSRRHREVRPAAGDCGERRHGSAAARGKNEDALMKRTGALLSACAEAGHTARRRWDAIAKPVDGLGRLEDIIIRIAGITGSADIGPLKKAVVVMCGDHGVAAEGVSQTEKSVTVNVANSIAAGTSTINLMADKAGADVFVVDAGTDADINRLDRRVISRRIARGTGNIAEGSAMTREEACAAVLMGMDFADELAGKGYGLIAAGEMGIGNTTPAAAMACAFTGGMPEKLTGRGAGLSDEGLARKKEIVRRALLVNAPDANDALDVLAKLGGYEIAAMTGLFLSGLPVIIDGAVSAAAAAAAVRLSPAAADYMIMSSAGREPAFEALAELIGKRPLLDAGTALGEGTAAVMMFPLIDMALSVYNGGRTFEKAGIGAYERYETRKK